jgi:hypothetical protein
MNFDGAGITTIDSENQITLVCGNSRIDMFENGTILINGNKIGVSGSTSIGIGVGNEDSVTSGIGIEAATLDVTTQKLTMCGESEASLEAHNINIEGEGETKIVSGKVKLN